MNRRLILKTLTVAFVLIGSFANLSIFQMSMMAASEGRQKFIETVQGKDWLERWEINIIKGERDRFCDHELGEELGWFVSPFLNGFYYGYLATEDPKWSC